MKNYILLIFLIIFFVCIFPASGMAISPFDLVNLKDQGLADIIAYDKIKIIDAWNFLERALPILSPVSIGIFDTGIDITHPEFRQVSIDTPIIADTLGSGHGTQVAGIIGANNLSFGGTYTPPQMNGILSGARNLNYTLRIRFSSDFAKITLRDSFRHFLIMDQLAKSGVNIINSSFGAPLCSKLTFFQRAAYLIFGKSCYLEENFNTAKGIYADLINQYSNITFVFATGNDGIDAQFNLPGGGVNTQNTINIGAADLIDKRAVFSSVEESNFGPTVSISTPGVDVYSPQPDNQYDKTFSGTSASAPMVTGVAAILKSIKPELTPGEIKDVLQKSADPIKTDQPLGSGCFDPNNNSQGFNGCRLNALKAAQAIIGKPPTAVSLNIYPRFTEFRTAVRWTQNTDPDFASYEIIRNTQSILTTPNRNTVWHLDETAPFTPLSYFVSVKNQTGLTSLSNESTGRKFSPQEISFRIPGVPEPGDIVPLDIAVPTFIFSLSVFDCPRDIFFSCTGPFINLSTLLDQFGHVGKFRSFNAFINNLQINDQPNFKFNVHNGDIINISLTAQDQDYQVFVPFLGLFNSIPRGQSRPFGFGVLTTGTFDIIVQTAVETRPQAGTLNVLP